MWLLLFRNTKLVEQLEEGLCRCFLFEFYTLLVCGFLHENNTSVCSRRVNNARDYNKTQQSFVTSLYETYM
jgi:hypothetical protein